MAIQVMICSTTQNVLISATLSAFLLLSNAFVPIALHQYFHIFILSDTLYTVHRSLYVPVNPCLSCVLSMYLPTILMVSVYSVRSLRSVILQWLGLLQLRERQIVLHTAISLEILVVSVPLVYVPLHLWISLHHAVH